MGSKMLNSKLVKDYIAALYGPFSQKKVGDATSILYKRSMSYHDDTSWLVIYYHDNKSFYFLDERKTYTLNELLEKAKELKCFL